MSKLCKFVMRGNSFLIDPDLVERVVEDTDDETCRLICKSPHPDKWVEGTIDEVHAKLNEGRS